MELRLSLRSINIFSNLSLAGLLLNKHVVTCAIHRSSNLYWPLCAAGPAVTNEWATRPNCAFRTQRLIIQFDKPIEPMKNSFAQSSKSRSAFSPKNQDESPLNGNLFLGHKLLAELRILMRLSSGSATDSGSSLRGNTGHSF